MQDYGRSREEVDHIIKEKVGLIIGELVNYFEVLGLNIDDLPENLTDAEIKGRVDAKFTTLYSQARLAPHAPRADERMAALIAAKDTLCDSTERQKHISDLIRWGLVPNPDRSISASIQQVAISGFSLAAIAFIARLILQFGTSGWLATHLSLENFAAWEYYWQLDEWFQWPWFEWKVQALSTPWSGVEFIIALASIGVGIFGFVKLFFKKNRVT